jgi:6-pyruvoyltetrahydropterin/6-carboxytetrahydropterin synthase
LEITVVKEFTFEASHYLPDHPGKCKNLHGHTYKLQVGVKGEVDPKTGMVVDFGRLKELVDSIIVEKLDHYHLNSLSFIHSDLQDFPSRLPTAEQMVKWIVLTLNSYFLDEWEGLVLLSFVRLYETPTSYAEWRATR